MVSLTPVSVSSTPSPTSDDSDCMIVDHIDTTPSKKTTSRPPHGSTTQKKAISGLISAMRRKSTKTNSPTLSPLSTGPVGELDPVHYSPSSAFATSTSDSDDSDDSTSLFLSQPKCRRRTKTNNISKTHQPPNKFLLSSALKRKASTAFLKPPSPPPPNARQNKRILFPAERSSLNILTQKPWLQSNQPTFEITGLQHGAPDQPFTFTSPRAQLTHDTMSIEDRKRFFIYTPTPAITAAMQTHVANIHRMFPVTRKIDDCMLHPNPKGLLKSGRYNQIITCRYVWRDDVREVHGIGINYGIVALLVNSHLTSPQREGFINAAWHLSHLCGNWICCNWRHHTVEPGAVNVGRNACFASSEACRHEPMCMKEKKMALNLPTVSPVKGGGVVGATGGNIGATGGNIGVIGSQAGADLSMEVEEEEEEEVVVVRDEGKGKGELAGGLQHVDTESSEEADEEESADEGK